MLVGNQVINDLPNDVYQKEGAAFQIFAQQDTVSLEIKAVNSFSDDSQFIFRGPLAKIKSRYALDDDGAGEQAIV